MIFNNTHKSIKYWKRYNTDNLENEFNIMTTQASNSILPSEWRDLISTLTRKKQMKLSPEKPLSTEAKNTTIHSGYMVNRMRFKFVQSIL